MPGQTIVLLSRYSWLASALPLPPAKLVTGAVHLTNPLPLWSGRHYAIFVAPDMAKASSIKMGLSLTRLHGLFAFKPQHLLSV